MRKEDIANNIVSDIGFVTDKLNQIRKEFANQNRLDIKQQADLHRYAETRLCLVKTLSIVEKW